MQGDTPGDLETEVELEIVAEQRERNHRWDDQSSCVGSSFQIHLVDFG